MTLRDSVKALRHFANSQFNLIGDEQLRELFSRPTLPRLEEFIQDVDGFRKTVSIDENARREWYDVCSKRSIGLSRRAKRHLCWDPQIAITSEFLKYLGEDSTPPTVNHLKGLMYACHQGWKNISDGSLMAARRLVAEHAGSNRTIAHWKTHLDGLLSREGTLLMSDMLVSERHAPSRLAALRGIAEDTPFFGEIVEFSFERCIKEMSSDEAPGEAADYLMNSLLTWNRISITTYKNYLSKTILSRIFDQDMDIRTELTSRILRHPELGDPRLKPLNWQTIDANAKRRFIQCLSEDDIIFFFDHVMSDTDRSVRRKHFWLKYVSKIERSFPVLNAWDKVRLSKFRRKGGAEFNFGEKLSGNSAFILDFGNLLVIEFNDIGACFMYAEPTRSRFFEQVFDWKTYTDYQLKKQHLANGGNNTRLIHMGDWEEKFSQQLATYDIRR